MNLVAPSPSPHHPAALADDGAEDADPYALAAQSLPSGWREEEVVRLLNRDDADALMRATVFVGHNNVSVAAVIDTGSGPSWINSDTLRRIDAGITDPRLRCPAYTRASGGNAVYTADGQELPRDRQVLLSIAFDDGVHVEQAGPYPPSRVTMLVMAYVVNNLVAPLIIGNGALRQHRAVLRPAEHCIEFKGMRLQDGTTANISVSTLRSGSVTDAGSSTCNVIVAPNPVQRARQAARAASDALPSVDDMLLPTSELNSVHRLQARLAHAAAHRVQTRLARYLSADMQEMPQRTTVKHRTANAAVVCNAQSSPSRASAPMPPRVAARSLTSASVSVAEQLGDYMAPSRLHGPAAPRRDPATLPPLDMSTLIATGPHCALNDEEHARLLALLNAHRDCFGITDDDVGDVSPSLG